jgi:hypothetical protein
MVTHPEFYYGFARTAFADCDDIAPAPEKPKRRGQKT